MVCLNPAEAEMPAPGGSTGAALAENSDHHTIVRCAR